MKAEPSFNCCAVAKSLGFNFCQGCGKRISGKESKVQQLPVIILVDLPDKISLRLPSPRGGQPRPKQLLFVGEVQFAPSCGDRLLIRVHGTFTILALIVEAKWECGLVDISGELRVAAVGEHEFNNHLTPITSIDGQLVDCVYKD